MTGPVYEFMKTFHGIVGRRPWTVVEAWETLVADCEDGYEQNEYEYRYDCRVRKSLEKGLNAPEMKSFPEQVREMKGRVYAADDRLRALFIPDVQIGSPAWEWWERGVLRNGAGEYAEDMKRSYGVDLEKPPGSGEADS